MEKYKECSETCYFGYGDASASDASMRKYYFDDAPSGLTPSLRNQRNVTTWYPSMKFLYPFQFEVDFRFGGSSCTFCHDYFSVAWIAVCLYLAFCYFGPKWMASREAFEVKSSWRAWNLALSIFSICGSLRTMPHLIGIVHNEGLYTSVCSFAAESYGAGGASALWTMLFIFSKLPELIDTVFIVLGKRKLIFLHWYHHATVLLFCWHSYATRSSAGLWFVAMNYTVHAVMYMYFFLVADRSLRKRCKLSLVALFVTTMQISQMVVGVTITFLIYRYKSQGLPCYTSQSNFLMGFLMYLSYFALFAAFAARRFCGLCPAEKPKEE